MQQKKPAPHRSIQKRNDHLVNPALSLIDFPIDTPGVIYVRQSTLAQVQKNLHSYEMQTEKFVEHFRAMGITKHIEIIADDEGKSGTLDIHDREGLTRVVRLIEGKELINGERVGWVGAVHVNRFTRDPWLVTPGVLMKECYNHDVWVATLRMNFNFKDEYCQRVFMLEAEEAARHLKWMKLVLGGGRWAASDKGIYDARWVAAGYIVDYREFIKADIKNPTHKKYIPYEPHAEVVRWLYKRYLELDGNFAALCREVDAMPYLFPPFEDWVPKKNVNKMSAAKTLIKDGPYRGCYKSTADGLQSILTNPAYLGWWIPAHGGLVKDNHAPLIEEDLFYYAHKRLSVFDLNGNRQKPMRVVRSDKTVALIKKFIKPLNLNGKQRIYCKEGFYVCRTDTGLRQIYEFSVLTKTIDDAFTDKFLERLDEWQKGDELKEWKDELEQQSAHEETKRNIQKAINEANAQMKHINGLISDPEYGFSPSQIRDLNGKYADLEARKEKLENDLANITESGEAEEITTLFLIWELIPKIREYWGELPFEERVKIVGAFTREAILSNPSSGWLKLDITWKIGTTDTMHLKRGSYSGTWTAEEDAIVKELYPSADGAEILEKLPRRTWRAIMHHAANYLHVERQKWMRSSVIMTDYYYSSWEDMIYAEQHNLHINDKNPQWSINTKVPFCGMSN